MKLPNAECAIISIEKLVGYCLNPEHPKGKHKVRVFQSILGINCENADRLYELVRQAAIAGKVVQERLTPFGQEYLIEFADSQGCEYAMATLHLRSIIQKEIALLHLGILRSPLNTTQMRLSLLPPLQTAITLSKI
jgi:hypothetical protein